MINAINNVAFGQAVGCHHSMASRILNGKRLPSADLMARIAAAYNLDLNELHKARAKGAPAFGAYLQRTVIRPANRAAKVKA